MRNYRDLTPHEVERLKDEYPITANRRLAIRYDVSIDGISKLAKNLGWKKDRSSVCTGSSGCACRSDLYSVYDWFLPEAAGRPGRVKNRKR